MTISHREVELAAASVTLAPGRPVEVSPAAGRAEGVLIATVWDGQGAPLAERLIFRAPAHALKVDLRTDKKSYVPGDTVKLTARATRDGKPVAAVLGLTVTDDAVLEMIEKREQSPRLPGDDAARARGTRAGRRARLPRPEGPPGAPGPRPAAGHPGLAAVRRDERRRAGRAARRSGPPRPRPAHRRPGRARARDGPAGGRPPARRRGRRPGTTGHDPEGRPRTSGDGPPDGRPAPGGATASGGAADARRACPRGARRSGRGGGRAGARAGHRQGGERARGSARSWAGPGRSPSRRCRRIW